ncbi:cupin domain-containing protein [Methanoplanus endosymbiosus]|uniref:Cupin domain-containing protein n=1 Tax=Methanoplanus endosymbiosus TaxID=33865 RepID=A0A9E7PPY8_9EURY|nr:cupin domain-containing protein [Methanoplanus endosymbiosus]UUX92904.1 cupin domain-containing protein [Methanoplanus endosymbiosus]
MYRILSITLILICISAGCITGSSDQAAEPEQPVQTDYQKPAQAVCLITPGEELSIFGGWFIYEELIGAGTPEISTNYSLGYVTVPSGNTTTLHRLLDRSEFFGIISGEAEIKCDNATVTVGANEYVILPQGVLQSATSVGDEELVYINVVNPVYTPESEITGENVFNPEFLTDKVPIVIQDPGDGSEWDIGSDMMIYSVVNPVLMPEMNAPVDYSVAYAELLPGGVAEDNCLKGSSELICVIKGEIEVYAPGGNPVRVTAGNAAYIPPNQTKGYRNVAEETSTMLSFVSPALTF